MAFVPRNALPVDLLIEECLPPEQYVYYQSLCIKGWRFYIVDQRCGKCYFGDKVITIPAWLWRQQALDSNLFKHDMLPNKQNKELYRIWYICHEMAHAYAFIYDKHMEHGKEFMRALKEVCPPEAQGFEIGYKPRAALAAGIMPVDF